MKRYETDGISMEKVYVISEVQVDIGRQLAEVGLWSEYASSQVMLKMRVLLEWLVREMQGIKDKPVRRKGQRDVCLL